MRALLVSTAACGLLLACGTLVGEPAPFTAGNGDAAIPDTGGPSPDAFGGEDGLVLAADAAPKDARISVEPDRGTAPSADAFVPPDAAAAPGDAAAPPPMPDASVPPPMPDASAPPPMPDASAPPPVPDAAVVPAPDAAVVPAPDAAPDAALPVDAALLPDAAPRPPCDPALGECLCERDAHCVDGTYCHDNGRCAVGCRLDPDPCVGGVCDPFLHECLPPPCARDADCGPGLVCGLRAGLDGIDLRCAPPSGVGGDGDACELNFDCATALCSNLGYCFTPCADGEDCASGRCEPIGITWEDLPGQRFEFSTCASPPDLCRADAECAADEVCRFRGEDVLAPGTPLVACAPDLGGAPPGSRCATGADCGSGVCLNATRTCWGPCRSELAGADCAVGQRCYENGLHITFDQGTPSGLDDVAYGLPTCLTEAGSAAPCAGVSCDDPAEICTTRLNRNRTGYDLICRTPIGDGGPGAPCVGGDECQTGICLGLGVCFGLCDPQRAGTCAAGSACRVVNFQVDDRGTPNNPADDIVTPLPACVR
jgi:hypothetical protein